jgi:hypothetical protein
MQRWKAYWIMRGVEAYLCRIGDTTARELVTSIVDALEREQSTHDTNVPLTSG